MVSLHKETARFKSPGHKNELCFFWNTLACVDKNVGHQYIWFYQDQTINNIFDVHTDESILPTSNILPNNTFLLEAWILIFLSKNFGLCVLFKISLSCTLFNELVINMFSCLRVMRLSGLKVRFHTFSSNSFLLLLRTFERIYKSAQIVGKCCEKWAET